MRTLILDAYNLMHRARSGFQKGNYPVIFNFFRSLRPLVEKFKPDVIYFVLEGQPKKNLESLGSYKGSREVDPNLEPKKHKSLVEFHRQKSIIIDLIENYLPVICVRHGDYEADDVMAELAHQHKEDDVTIVSGDSDMIQVLQTTSCKLWHPIKKEFLEAPEYDYVTWKALRGDPTDDIPGIPGVGDKTAEKLVRDPVLMESRFEKKPDERTIFIRNKRLIKLARLPWDDVQTLSFRPGRVDWDELKSSFDCFGFRSMLKDKTWKKYVDTFDCVTVTDVGIDDNGDIFCAG